MPNKSLAEKENLQSIARDNFLPSGIYQETIVKEYQPRIITVGIGGNDVGFASKLQACLNIGNCDWADTDEGREKSAIEIKGIFNKLVSTYQNIKNDSQNAKIYAIGYPRLIKLNGSCPAFMNGLLSDTERIFVDEGLHYLNEVIEAAAKKAGIKYINIEEAFGEHRLCGMNFYKAVNFISHGDDVALMNDSIKWLKLVGQETFHPNSLGHELSSEIITDVIKNDNTDYSYCNGITACPENVFAPEP